MATKMFALGEVKAVEDTQGDPNGEFDVILSAPTTDRDGEVIDARCFDPLPDHITFDIDHGMSTATTVGSGTPRYEDDGTLRVRGTYSSIPRAQEVRTLVREGHIRTTSVAFMSAEREQKDGVTHVTKAELLNGAFVPIPSNRESVVLSAKNHSAKILQPLDVVAVKAVDLTANELREAVDQAVRAAYGGDEVWVWVRDFTDEWVVFCRETDETVGLYRQTYVITDGVPALTGDAEEVRSRTTYEPVEGTPLDSPPAPATPADTLSAGKSPASDQVDSVARTRVDAFLLTEDIG